MFPQTYHVETVVKLKRKKEIKKVIRNEYVLGGQGYKKNEVEMLALLMKDSRNTVVLTGAGMDTESNIPDFRGGKSGWWRNIDPSRVASVQTLQQTTRCFTNSTLCE